MSTLVRQSGLQGGNSRFNTRAALTLPDGSAVLVVHDSNSAGAATGYGDHTNTEKIYVYSSADRINWTLRNTITPAVLAIRLTANVAPDGTLGIVYWTSTVMRYVSVNTSTWVAAAQQTPRTALTGTATADDYDFAFTDGNVPVIFTLRADTTGSTRLALWIYTRRTSDSTWIASTPLPSVEDSKTSKTAYQALSGLVLTTGGTAAARNVVAAVGHGNGPNDNGVMLYTMKLDETSGVVSSVTKRATYAVGEVPGTTTAIRARNVLLFPSDDNEYTLGIEHSDGANTTAVTRGTFSGTTWVETIPYNSQPHRKMDTVQYGMTMTYSSGRLTFIYSDSSGNLTSILAKIDPVAAAVTFSSGRYWFDSQSKVSSISPVGGTGRFVHYPTHDIVFIYKIDGTHQQFCHHYVVPSHAPKGVQPANGSTITTAQPTVRASADLDLAYPQSLVKIQWEFATDPAFSVNYFAFVQGDDKLITVEGTDKTSVLVPVEDSLPLQVALSKQGTWYVRASHVDEYGVIGTPSAANSFVVAHLPVPANIDPTTGQVRGYTTGLFLHKWQFTDPWENDHQTAYQIQVTNLDTSSVVADTGKVVDTVSEVNVALPVGVVNARLQSSIRLWDADDVVGLYVAGGSWMTVYAPVVTINTPVAGGTVTTAIPNLNFTVTFGGVRTIVKYQVNVVETVSGDVVYSTGWMATNMNSGDTKNWIPPVEVLENNKSYQFVVTVQDNFGSQSLDTAVQFSTAWVPPVSAGATAATVTPYNIENQGWVAVTWSDATRDPDFTSWVVYAKMDLIDPSTQAVLQDGEWEPVYEEFTTAPTYLYKDYWAKSGYKVNYRVEQKVTRFGDQLASSNGAVRSVYPVSDSYWVIDYDNGAAWKLGNVTSDSYNDEYEEAEYTVIGRGRKVDVGERIGYSGTLTAQLRDSPGLSARQKRLRLEELKTTTNRRLYLRNPFGDVFRVAVRAMTIARIAGVGLSEFVDVTIPYSEVGE